MRRDMPFDRACQIDVSGLLFCAIAAGERLALNLLQRMCGIASETRRFVDAGKLHDLVDALGAIEWAPGKKVRIVALEDVRGSLNIFDKVAGALRAAIAGKFSRGSLK